MDFRIRKSSIFWLVIAAGVFVAAIYLTGLVTKLEPDPIATDKYMPEGDSHQVATIYTSQLEQPDYPYQVDFSDALKDKMRISFFVHPADNPVIVLSARNKEPDCYLVSGFRAPDPPPDLRLMPYRLVDPETHQDVYSLTVAWPADAPDEQIVRCYVPSPTREESFTGRAVDVFSEIRPLPAQPDALAVPLTLRFSGIVGARDLHFRGGADLPEGSDTRELARALRPGTWMTASWESVDQLALRDIALIVIGTLIGIGVTVMIEGIRPMVDSLGGDESGSPRRRRHQRESGAKLAPLAAKKNDVAPAESAKPDSPSGPTTPS